MPTIDLKNLDYASEYRREGRWRVERVAVSVLAMAVRMLIIISYYS